MNEYLVSCAGTMRLKALFHWMEERFPIPLLPEENAMEADFLFCDILRPDHERFRRVKILITGENHSANLNHFDYCLTHGYQENDRCHLSIPFSFRFTRTTLRNGQRKPLSQKEEGQCSSQAALLFSFVKTNAEYQHLEGVKLNRAIFRCWQGSPLLLGR